MFTGIVSAIGTIVSADRRGDLHLKIDCPWEPEDIAIGASIACSGVSVETSGVGPVGVVTSVVPAPVFHASNSSNWPRILFVIGPASRSKRSRPL